MGENMRIVGTKPYYQKSSKSDTLEDSEDIIDAYFYCADCEDLSDGILEDNLVIDVDKCSKICGIELTLPKGELIEKDLARIPGREAVVLVSDDNPQTFRWYIDSKRKIVMGISDDWEKTYKLSDAVCIGVKDGIIVMWWFKLPVQ